MSDSSTRLLHRLQRETYRYALFGALFGLTFPIAGTLLQMLLEGGSLTLSRFIELQRTEPILWIVDTAPFVLGIFAALAGRRQDALLQLNDELNIREKELQNARTTLEQRVADRTQELLVANDQIEKRASRLQAIAEISQAIALAQNLNELFPLITRAISERLGFYHTGIFLVDDSREFAVMKAASSEGGLRMLRRGHKLRIDGTGLVSFVAQTGRARIALETGGDTMFLTDPSLPETRSEMCLPLTASGEVIGVLDVQSVEASAFSDEDVDTLNTLATQVAIVIQNVRLLDQAQTALRNYMQTGPQGWLEHVENRVPGYSYLPDGTVAAPALQKQKQIQTLLESERTVVLDSMTEGSSPTLAIPVRLRDQVIGIIHIEARDAGRKWSENEVSMVQSISERTALALENARLFEDTSRRVERERIVSQVTSRISESNDFDRILQTTIQELGRTLGATRTFIQLETPGSASEEPHTTESLED